MTFALALLPVVAIVSLGLLLASRRSPPAEGWRGIERLCYVLLFPALIVKVLAGASFEGLPWRMALALVAAQLLMAAIGHGARLWPGVPRPRVGSIIQSNVRWNTFVALALAGALFGEEGIALTAVAAAAMIPVANITSVLAFTRYGAREIERHPFVEVLRNPLVIACVIGATVNASGVAMPGVVAGVLDTLAGAAVGVGLLAAGAGIDLATLQRAGLQTLLWSLLRLLLLPVAAITFARALGVGGMELAVMAIAAATPTATNGYILARELGGDAPFMANLIAAQTVLAVATMPFIIGLFGLL